MAAAQTVLITGCAHGIGRHLAGAFCRRGWQVVATDYDLPALQAAATAWDPARCLLLPLDVRHADAWEAAVAAAQERFGALHVFINNAGIVAPEFAAELTVAAIDQQVDVNLKGVLYGSRLAARLLREQGHGHLINLASLAGVAPIHGLPVYSATKYAVRGFTLAVAHELAQYGAHVSVICPDLVQTNMLTQQLDYPAAALTFSGPGALRVQDVEQAVFFNALHRRQVEILLPAGRGWLARLANLWPRLGRLLTARLVAKGQQAQQTYRQTHLSET
ncbi:SDR family oxidoreductase [Hymenobacter weizhouensis]|uniref:SDR family oxidoreductase n=1 Tax=Hymenobacter sp. YIM 151500-1 TaxID=2987689 RepID=UPI002227A181|nr:SDR family oxidoreductase [Hymenobacter sp. YIM 151500-1]UYZ62282.1 SDR family oxidoreductase [Hymenobacter sp. YIM 151500-1]